MRHFADGDVNGAQRVQQSVTHVHIARFTVAYSCMGRAVHAHQLADGALSRVEQ